MAEITQRFCSFLSSARFDHLPPPAIHNARRGILDWCGCALGGSPHAEARELADILAATASGDSPLLGAKRSLGAIDAAVANGFAAHVLDFDDTRGTAPIVAAAFAIMARGGVHGRDLLTAYAAGIETIARIAAVIPDHHRRGWHPIGTLGALGAAVAAGKLLNLSSVQFENALGIAATQAAGLQQNRGTPCKPLHAGKAAGNGLLAALLAQKGFDSTDGILESERGFFHVYGERVDLARLNAGLGEDWAVTRNVYKPYACGLVLHPVIDAMLALRPQGRATADITAIVLRCHPLVATVGGSRLPETGAEAKFSAAHIAAAALIDGQIGLAQFTDARVQDPAIRALRRKVTVTTDETLRSDQAVATIAVGERRHTATIEAATGSPGNPMSDAALMEKFTANAAPVIGAEKTRQAGALIMRIEQLADTRDLVRLCC
ncbi:MAG: MmgE/PrpD family protein [Pseudorhodoplanes sp.]